MVYFVLRSQFSYFNCYKIVLSLNSTYEGLNHSLIETTVWFYLRVIKISLYTIFDTLVCIKLMSSAAGKFILVMHNLEVLKLYKL